MHIFQSLVFFKTISVRGSVGPSLNFDANSNVMEHHEDFIFQDGSRNILGLIRTVEFDESTSSSAVSDGLMRPLKNEILLVD